MAATSNKNLLPEFDSIKDDDEEILWTGKPKFIPYVITGLGLGIGAFIFLLFYYNMIKSDASGNLSIWFGLIPVIIFLLSFLKKIFSYNNTRYAFSNKRVMVRSGFIGTGFKIIDYDKISDMEVTVNFFERIFNVGTIKFYSGRTEVDDGIATKLYDSWEAITDPYGIFKQLKKVSVDIKTDYNYPNALRPSENPGYGTKYNPKS